MDTSTSQSNTTANLPNGHDANNLPQKEKSSTDKFTCCSCSKTTKNSTDFLDDFSQQVGDVLSAIFGMNIEFAKISAPNISPLEQAFSDVRKFDTYLADDAMQLTKVDSAIQLIKKKLEDEQKAYELQAVEARKLLHKRQEKDTVDRTKAVETLVQLVTQYNVDHPDANLDVTLSPPTLCQAYFLHKEQLKFKEKVASEKAEKKHVESNNEDTEDESNWTKEKLALRNLDMLRKLGELSNRGVKLSQTYNMNSDYKTMKFEYDLHSEIRSKQDDPAYVNVPITSTTYTEGPLYTVVPETVDPTVEPQSEGSQENNVASQSENDNVSQQDNTVPQSSGWFWRK